MAATSEDPADRNATALQSLATFKATLRKHPDIVAALTVPKATARAVLEEEKRCQDTKPTTARRR